MEAKSFKQMIQAGEVKRADAMKVQLDDIHAEPGFNTRDETPEFWQGINQFAQYIAAGGIFPPLEVRPRTEGGVYVVEGHRRRLALLKARDGLGAPIEWVNVVAFQGNDADRVARIVTSNSQVPLTPLETARVYKKLRGLGLGAEDIATRVGKTRQHVDQLLILADANTDVHKMVAAGEVPAAVAVEVARKHGENAGQVLQQELEKAKAAGKRKVTAGTINGKTLPPKVLQSLADEVDAFFGVMTKTAKLALAEAKASNTGAAHIIPINAGALLALMDEHHKITEARQKLAEKARAKAGKAAKMDVEDAA